MRCNPRDIVKDSPLTERIRYKNGETNDIIKVIMDMDKVADKYVDPEAAQCLAGSDDYETLRNIWKFVKGNVRYKADKRGKEVVKSPSALFAIGQGDCKSFSIAEVALLRALGFKGIRYRFTSYDGGDITHVYVVCKLGGKDVILDAVHSRFDSEVAYAFKKDVRASTSNGIGAMPTENGNHFLKLFALGLIAWGLIHK